MFSVSKQKGFTIVELAIVIVLIGIIGGITGLTLSQAVPGSILASNKDSVSWQARVGLARMEREIREAAPPKITTATASTFAFEDASGNAITYTLSGTQLLRNSQPLIDNLSTFGFAYYNGGGAVAPSPASIRYVVVELQATKDGVSSPTLRTSIALRNKE